MRHLMKAAGWMIFDFRCSIGMALLCAALHLLPRSFSICDGIRRGLREQADYECYAGYTVACGAAPVDFERWLRTRPASRCRVLDTSHLYVVREKTA